MCKDITFFTSMCGNSQPSISTPKPTFTGLIPYPPVPRLSFCFGSQLLSNTQLSWLPQISHTEGPSLRWSHSKPQYPSTYTELSDHVGSSWTHVQIGLSKRHVTPPTLTVLWGAACVGGLMTQVATAQLGFPFHLLLSHISFNTSHRPRDQKGRPRSLERPELSGSIIVREILGHLDTALYMPALRLWRHLRWHESIYYSTKSSRYLGAGRKYLSCFTEIKCTAGAHTRPAPSHRDPEFANFFFYEKLSWKDFSNFSISPCEGKLKTQGADTQQDGNNTPVELMWVAIAHITAESTQRGEVVKTNWH